MEKIPEIFNNRELAIFCWVLLILIGLFSQKSIREATIPVISSFFKLSKWYIIMIFYVVIWISLFYWLKVWDCSILKDSIYWMFGVAFILFLNVNKAIENKKHFYKITTDCFKLIIILEFLTNLYSFNIVIELISIPLILIISLISAFSEYNKIDINFKKLSNTLISIYGFAVLIYSIIKVSKDFNAVITIDHLKSILLSPVLTILFIPFLYFIALYMAYESFLKMKKYILKENIELYRFTKWLVIMRCRFSLRRIHLVSKKLHIYTSIDRTKIINEINIILDKNKSLHND